MIKVSKWVLIFGLFLFTDSVSGNSGNGASGTRGGGDLMEWSFHDLANEIVSTLQISNEPELAKVKSELLKVLPCLTVEISKGLYLDLDQRSVSAINEPDSCKITLSRHAWAEYGKSEERVRLVIHELLGLARQEDKGYALSKKLSKSYFHLKTQVSANHSTSALLTNSGPFIVPPGVEQVRVLVVGGGGGGGGGHLNYGSGGGGGGGGAVRASILKVTPKQVIQVVVGSGGEGGLGGGVDGKAGEESRFGNLLVAQGGGGGLSGTKKGKSENSHGGRGGGSGGGGGGNGILEFCSGTGGVAGGDGQMGVDSKTAGKGGKGSKWSPLGSVLRNLVYEPGRGGACVGPIHTYNGGGGGGGIILNGLLISAASGVSGGQYYGGTGGSGGTGYGAGGGGGTGGAGSGGQGTPGVVYVEY